MTLTPDLSEVLLKDLQTVWCPVWNNRLGHMEETGQFFEYDYPWVSVEEWSNEEKVGTEGLLDLVKVPDKKSEGEAFDLAIDWMIEHQTEEEIKSALEERV